MTGPRDRLTLPLWCRSGSIDAYRCLAYGTAEPQRPYDLDRHTRPRARARRSGRGRVSCATAAKLSNATVQERTAASWEKRSVNVPVAMQSAHLPKIKEVRPQDRDLHSPVVHRTCSPGATT